VYIPLPNEMHLPWTIAAAEAGKHVLCEKPLALDAQQAREMAHACRQNGVVLMEAFMWRHQPRTHDLLRRVRSSEIGELRLLRSSFSFSIDHSDWRLDPARGGGALMDVGCYGVSMARLFTGTEPTHASTMIHSSGTQVDMTLTTQLRFPGGALAVIDCSFEQPYRCCYELVGQSGSFEVAEAYLPTCSPSAILRTLGTDATPAESHRLSFDSADQYAKMIDAFGDSVDAGRLQPLCEDGVSQMEAIDMIRRSLV
jgi:predicted dehydrogenase